MTLSFQLNSAKMAIHIYLFTNKSRRIKLETLILIFDSDKKDTSKISSKIMQKFLFKLQHLSVNQMIKFQKKLIP